LVPFAAGGNADQVTRIIAQRLGEGLGQQFVVENRPGAAGAIATEAVARASNDGYTLLMGSPPQIAIIPVLTKTTYNPAKDFFPVSNIGTNPFVLVVNPRVPAKTLAEFVDHVRSQPNKLSYAAAGPGSLTHLTAALFLKRAGVEMVAVQYKGNAPALSDVVGGHVQAMFSNLSDALPHAAAGTVRLLAVTSDKRAPKIPDVPTLIESGYPGFTILVWNGLFAPAGTPKDIVSRIAQEAGRAVRDPNVVKSFAAIGVDPIGSNPEDFAATVTADIALWAEAIKVAGVQ
jgi:tripartite-type tricarboxylate transporter receptor subunit TctC